MKVIFAAIGPIACRPGKPACATCSNWRKFCCWHCCSGLFRRIDLWYENSPCSHVQGATYENVTSSRNAYHRHYFCNICSTDEILQSFKTHRSMLHVQKHKIIAGIPCTFYEGGITCDHKRSKYALFRVQCVSERFYFIQAGEWKIFHNSHPPFIGHTVQV